MKRRRYIRIYILSSSMWRGREILFAARDEKTISFRWSPLITHPVYHGCRAASCIETGSLYLEDQCFSIATIWRQSNNNTSLWLSVFSPLFSLHPLAAAATKSLWKSYSIIHTQTLICLIYLLFRPSLLFNAFCSRYVARTTRHHHAIERV
jgi:hypothetical protein